MWTNHKTERHGVKKKKGTVIPVHAMEAHKGSGGIASQGEKPNTHYIGGWVGPRASLDILEERKICCSYQDSNPGPSSL